MWLDFIDRIGFCLWVVVGGGEERWTRCWTRGSMGKDCGDGGCGGRVVGLNPSFCCWFDCVGFVNWRGRAGLFGRNEPSIFVRRRSNFEGFGRKGTEIDGFL